ncbi:pyrroline-5-carboxylate reductase [Candidatus Desantisbacteria bacterium]|nr:pyrroline-5-carboxylate reductase [Candidatus Desantisbacteria bacterium]
MYIIIVLDCKILILAVKPQNVASILKEISPYFSTDKLIVSIAAGINTHFIAGFLGDNSRIIRVMPNTPAFVKEGMSVICKAGKAKDADLEEVRNIFKSIGEVEELSENYFNAVTAMSGSGPAYILLMIEALMDAGINTGLSKDISLLLASQTVLGSAKLLKETKEHPAELKNKICSPAGTTIAGLYKLEKGGFRGLVMEAVKAAKDRSEEIEKQYGSN